MPIFELSEDELANPTRLTLSRLENLMLWPADTSLQQEAAETAAAVYAIDQARSLPMISATGAEIADLLKLALDALPPTCIQARAKDHFQRGVIAGRIVHGAIGWRNINPTM